MPIEPEWVAEHTYTELEVKIFEVLQVVARNWMPLKVHKREGKKEDREPSHDDSGSH